MTTTTTKETFKRGRSASSLWTWFDKLRWDHHQPQRRRHSAKESTPVKLSRSRRETGVTSDDEFIVSCLTLDESPVKRRTPKRITRPVSCYLLTSSDQEKNRPYNETHFPSKVPILQQRVRGAESIPTFKSFDTIDRQVWIIYNAIEIDMIVCAILTI